MHSDILRLKYYKNRFIFFIFTKKTNENYHHQRPKP